MFVEAVYTELAQGKAKKLVPSAADSRSEIGFWAEGS